MKKIVFLLMMVAGIVSAQKTTQTISGTVTDGLVPLKNAKIEINGSSKVLYSDAEGRYTLKATPGNTITYSYAGLKTIEIRVEDVTSILNIDMFPDITELDGVTVTKSRRKSREDLEIEFQTNPSLIRTAYGILDGTRTTYQVRILEADQINEVGICILGILIGQFPGLKVSGDCFQGGSISFRGASSINFVQSAIFDVDGLILNDAPVWIPVGNIQRVAVLSGLAARNLYGGIASGGVVIINTNAGNAFAQSKELKDKARLRDNLYANDALDQNTIIQNGPIYLKELYASKDGTMAYTIYEKYKPNFGSSYAFVLDAYRCLSEQFNNTALADRILKDNEALFETNSLAMNALAYTYQAKGEFKSANELYKQVFIKRPNYVQSYLDLANSYREIADYKKAAGLFSRFEYLTQQGYFAVNDTTMISNLMDREFSNLLKLKGEKILSKNEQIIIETTDTDFEGTRLVFEWNDSEAEFELQFVNPEGHYFTSENSIIADLERIRDEKLLGYSTEEFLIDGSLPGTWQVNVKYLGNKQLTPSYLKAVVYYNYGTDAQRKETKIFKMGLKNVNQKLFTVNIPSMITN